ncbi:hypothetical protein [Okeania sp. SIO2B3]|uniref:hypothetical protein n=1 Tax=Okeania sp. SIO2B3 TaxID=2607784 RepID=UPI0025EE7F9D|nr:hypothetical protein [Okeania sp. SIO2B3]
MNQKIIALWSTPRSSSTAFRWMVKQRGDFLVLHEPFGRSAHYRTHLVSFLEIQKFEETRFKKPKNYKSSGNRKIMKNHCQNHKTQMDIGLVIC